MKKIFVLLVAGLGFFTLSCNQTTEPEEIVINNEHDSLSYCLGVSYAGQIRSNLDMSPIDSIDIELMAEAIVSSYTNNDLKIDEQTAISYLNYYFEKMSVQMQNQIIEESKDNIEAGRKFMEENAKRENVVVLPSGLQYEILRRGRGRKPVLTDSITVHFHGTLIDGAVFQSSLDAEPFSIRLMDLIPGWKEAIQLMPTGSKWKICVPPDLAYGDSDQGVIKPYSTLIFEIELIAIEK